MCGSNFEIFTPCDFIAAITQHIPDKNFQLVRYYGWYSNKMRGQRSKQKVEDAKAAGNAIEVIDVSEYKLAPHRDEVSGARPRRIPSAKWRELIKKVWEADPLLCPKCQKEMRIVSLIDDSAVIKHILRHLGLWEQGVRVSPARGCHEPRPKDYGSRAPPEIMNRIIPPSPLGYGGQAEPWLDDPFPDYNTEPVMAYANS